MHVGKTERNAKAFYSTFQMSFVVAGKSMGKSLYGEKKIVESSCNCKAF